jgi:nucleoside-diphosphate-sugar epimerase
MRVFVTGASGFIGSAIVQELTGAGYQVLGLARSDAAAKAVQAAGAEVLRGDVQDMESLQKGVSMADGVIHTAFNHDFSTFAANCEADRRAIEAMGTVLVGSNRPLIITSGIGVVRASGLITENTVIVPGPGASPRIASEQAADAVASKGVNVSVVRLPPSVHGNGDHGFVPALIDMARSKGMAAYVGAGLNRWPAVHRLDATRLYRLVLEKGVAGTRYHAVADEGIEMRDIVTVIGRQLQLPVVSLSPTEAAGYFGWMAHFASSDIPASSAQTQELLGWQPVHPGLLEDLEYGSYFREGAKSSIVA